MVFSLFWLTSILVFFSLGWWLAKNWPLVKEDSFFSPLVDQKKELPLLQYSIPNLARRTFQASPIKLEQIISEQPDYTTYLFSFTTYQQTMTGALNVPKHLTTQAPVNPPIIIMLRGYVPVETYQSGVGTKNAAAVLAKNGYITLAPDFFGFGASAPEPSDSWEARFIKPINVIELIKSVEEYGVPLSMTAEAKAITSSRLGIWAHSNGGQIALTTLEILNRPIPATLWAPVTTPFPYSVMFFSDEVEDEGKEMRKYVSVFERDYDAFDFSLTKHLNLLTGPIQIQQGLADEAIPAVWSDEFVDKLKTENRRRQTELKTVDEATPAATLQQLQPIAISYSTYPGADHNLKGSWDNAVQQDLKFFQQYLPVK